MAPSGINFIEVTKESVMLTWFSSEEANYEIQVGNSGFVLGSGQVTSSSDTTYKVDNLTSGTTYDLYVRTICNAQNISEWSEVQSFTTLSDCAQVLSSSVFNITETAAFITWQYSGNIPIGWIIEYAEEGFIPGTGIVAETSIDNIPLMNLSTKTHYEYYLTSKCIENNYGEPAGPYRFSTL